ncbi:MAG: hypothetical protein AABW83_03105 [Nanoarchaeota archaeon]
MKKDFLRIIGVSLIISGILGILLISTNIIGYAVSEEEQNLKFSEIEDITMKENENKIIIINAKNLGNKDLTNCKLTVSGEKSEWFSSEKEENILSNSDKNFNLNIKTPEKIEADEYLLELKLICDKESISKKIYFSIIKGVNTINIREIKSNKNMLNIIYTFNNEGFIGDSTYVEIWVKNPDGFEVNRIKDQFSINKDNLIIREVNIDLKKNPRGVYSVLFSHPSDSDNYIKKTVILGDSKTSGNVIFNIGKGKGFPYLIFLTFIAIGTFFIFRSHRKLVQQSYKSDNKKSY